jgi:hypothetical protein
MLMTQGQFTKQEARRVKEIAEEILSALPRSKKLEYFGHFNDLFLFLEAAERAAPDQSPAPVAVTS